MLVVLAMVVGAGSCSSPSPTAVNSWQKEGSAGKAYRRVLVFDVSRRPLVRRDIETAFVEQLNARGVDAVPSADYLPATQKAARELFDKVLANAKADAILVTRLADVRRRDQASEGTAAAVSPLPAGVSGLFEYYAWAWERVYDPPQVHQGDEVVTMESRLFDAKTGEVVWAGATPALQLSKDLKKDATAFARGVLSDLGQKGLVSGGR
jgi:hypothetical protein